MTLATSREEVVARVLAPMADIVGARASSSATPTAW